MERKTNGSLVLGSNGRGGETHYCMVYSWKIWAYYDEEIDYFDPNEYVDFHVSCRNPELFPELQMKSK